jgi:hypothetical protein
MNPGADPDTLAAGVSDHTHMPKRVTSKSVNRAVPEPTSKSKTLTNRLKPKQSPDAASAKLMVEGLGMNAATAVVFSRNLGELDLTECMAALIAETQRVQRGDLGGAEAMLTAQAVALNAMFTQLAYQTSKMTIVDQIDRFTRLALKAQAQCRATLETLALIKNPPTVFARQANIAHGPQQVNNNPPSPTQRNDPAGARGESGNRANQSFGGAW